MQKTLIKRRNRTFYIVKLLKNAIEELLFSGRLKRETEDKLKSLNIKINSDIIKIIRDIASKINKKHETEFCKLTYKNKDYYWFKIVFDDENYIQFQFIISEKLNIIYVRPEIVENNIEKFSMFLPIIYNNENLLTISRLECFLHNLFNIAKKTIENEKYVFTKTTKELLYKRFEQTIENFENIYEMDDNISRFFEEINHHIPFEFPITIFYEIDIIKNDEDITDTLGTSMDYYIYSASVFVNNIVTNTFEILFQLSREEKNIIIIYKISDDFLKLFSFVKLDQDFKIKEMKIEFYYSNLKESMNLCFKS